MDFTLTERETYFRDRVKNFIERHIRPRNGEYEEQQRSGDRWKVLPVIEEVKAIARAEGLWNFFMPPRSGQAHVDDLADVAVEFGRGRDAVYFVFQLVDLLLDRQPVV